jgi:hydrogenase maturation factor
LEYKLTILKLLNIEKAEVKFVFWPIIYSFFLGAAIAYFFTGSTALFLSSFEREMIPLSFIIAGVIVVVIGQIYSYIQQRYRFSDTVVGSLTFLLISLIVLIVSFSISHSIIIIFALYAWNRVVSYIHNVVFWGMAGRLFSMHQAKRVFRLISG